MRRDADKQQRVHVGMLMVVSALMMAHQVAGKAARDALFLSHFGTAALPAMVAVATITAVAASVVGSRTFVRLGPHRLVPASLALSGVVQIAEWVLLGYGGRIGAIAIYLHLAAFGALLLSSFWSLMSESFEPRSAKAVFRKIGRAGTLGALCGGLFAERVAAWFGMKEVMLLLGALHLACAGLLWGVRELRGPQSHAHPHEANPIDAVHRYPFLLVLAGFVITTSAGTALLDFVFKAEAAHSMGPGVPLLRFFAIYYTATSLLTFLLQMFLTRLCVQHAGLAVTAGSLPASISLGSLTALLVPGFPVLAAVRAGEIGLHGSLFRSGYELFYTAVAPGDKRAVKSLIDVGANRAGDVVGSAGVSLMLVMSPGRNGPVLAIACCMSIIAMLLALRLHRGYLQALETSLVDRAIELDPSMVEDRATHSVLMRSVEMRTPGFADRRPTRPPVETPRAGDDSFVRRAVDLRSGDISRAIRAAGEVGPHDWALGPLLIDMLAWDEAMPVAREALKRLGGNITGMLVDALLDAERDFVIRRRLPRVLVDLPSTRSVEGLFAALEDARFEVRFYAGRALFLLLKHHPRLSVSSERVWEAVNRELSLQGSVWNSRRLLDHRGSDESQWFFDDELLDRADRNLEHLFILLALLLPEGAVRIAFRALHTDDPQLKGTAFEYLESATPPRTRQLLLPMLEAAQIRSRAAADGRALENLLATAARVNRSLNLEPLQGATGQ